MAASPIPHDSGDVKKPDTWSRQDEQSSIAAPPSNGDAANTTNGAGHPTDDKRDTQPPSQSAPPEATGSSAHEDRSTSPSKQDGSQRGEKQIKVLVESYLLL